MRILFITDKFVPELGGSQIIFGKLYAHLSGHEVTVVTRDAPGAVEQDAGYPHRVYRVSNSRVPKLRSPLLWARMCQVAKRLLREEQFHQVHLGQIVETAPWGTALAARFGLPAIIHTFAEDVTSHLNHPLYTPMMRHSLSRASVITTISNYTKSHLEELGFDPSRIRLLYPGIQAEHWASTGREAAVRTHLGLIGARVILTVGRLIPRKGQDMVLRALPEVLARAPDTVYVIVGLGPEEERLRALAQQLGVSPRVRFVGGVNNRETVDYYRSCDVFAMPNRMMPNGDIEGFGLVFLEANACGKPVIAGRSGGAVDAVDDGVTGLLVDPTSPREIAARLVELLTDPQRAASLGEAGRARALTRFTWAASAQSLVAAIDLAAG